LESLALFVSKADRVGRGQGFLAPQLGGGQAHGATILKANERLL
jgi:hypothetical protein